MLANTVWSGWAAVERRSAAGPRARDLAEDELEVRGRERHLAAEVGGAVPRVLLDLRRVGASLSSCRPLGEAERLRVITGLISEKRLRSNLLPQ